MPTGRPERWTGASFRHDRPGGKYPFAVLDRRHIGGSYDTRGDGGELVGRLRTPLAGATAGAACARTAAWCSAPCRPRSPAPLGPHGFASGTASRCTCATPDPCYRGPGRDAAPPRARGAAPPRTDRESPRLTGRPG